MKTRSKDSIFTQAEMPNNPTAKFDLSHDVKTTFNMGELIPSLVMESLPGDQLKMNSANLTRFMPMVFPVMHNVELSTHYFFVPNRILHSGWEDFITGDSETANPFMTDGGASNFNVPKGSIGDYLGLPIAEGTSVLNPDIVTDAYIRAYLMIYNEYYRDQNLIAEVDITESEMHAEYENSPKRRAWQHDYFTSCLPFAQKGDEVNTPLVDQGQLDVILSGVNAAGKFKVASDGSNAGGSASAQQGVFSTGNDMAHTEMDLSQVERLYYDPNGTLAVDMNAEAVTIRTLRRALKLQEWLERNARGGTRYIEHILSHFGVQSSDKRLNRPEYLGGSKHKINFTEVLSTAETTDGVIGQFGGHGITAGAGNDIDFFSEEHGIIISLVSIMPNTGYFQGLHRQFTRKETLDFYWPSFADIGEQEVLNREIYFGNEPADNGTFGYIPRYAEYKYLNSRVSGEMRDTLIKWHLDRDFTTRPTLSEDFINCNPRDDIFAVDQSDHIIAHFFNEVFAKRKMPYFANPGL